MHITDLKLDVISVPRHTGFISQHGILRLISNTGVVGVGEMSDFSHLPKYALNASDLERTLASELIGRNPAEILSINTTMADMLRIPANSATESGNM